MATVYCDNCGASLLEETAKFCRACGKATPLSEAPTKRFDEPSVQVSTRPFAPSPTTPAYMAPLGPPPAQPTNDLRQKTQKRNLIILVSMLAFLIFALAGLLAFLNFGPGSEGIPPPDPTIQTPPGGRAGAGGVPVPPVPPLPPLPPGVNDASAIDSSLIYPGARQTMSKVSASGGRVLMLQSDDPASRVAAWYTAKLKVTNTVSIIGQTILEAGDLSVVILGSDEGAQIIIKRGDEK